MVELNRAVAVAMADDPAAGLSLVEALQTSAALAGYHLLPATRADPLRRLKRHAGAAASYREALEPAASDAERRHLARRLAETTRQGQANPASTATAEASAVAPKRNWGALAVAPASWTSECEARPPRRARLGM